MHLITNKQSKTIIPLKQLAYLLKQKTPISKSFNIVIKDIDTPEIKNIFTDVATSVNQGIAIEEAFAKHKNYFPEFMTNLISLGAQTGNINQTLNQYTLYLENRKTFIKNIQSALFYPMLLLIIFVISIFFLINFVFPQIINLFSENIHQLPLISKITINVLLFLENYFLLCILLFIFLITISLKTLIHFNMLDTLILKTPLIKTIIIKSEIILWLTSIQTSLKSGNMFFNAFKNASKTISNNKIKSVFMDLINAKEHGIDASLWETSTYLPEFFKANINNILENESSSIELIDDMCIFYKKDVSDKLSILLKLIEPVLIVIMGIIIGIVSISVLLPILDSSKIAAF